MDDEANKAFINRKNCRVRDALEKTSGYRGAMISDIMGRAFKRVSRRHGAGKNPGRPFAQSSDRSGC